MDKSLEDTLKESRDKKDSRLYILNGFLAEIPDLHEYVWVDELKIHNNKIKKIERSKLPPNLKKLDLYKNCVETIEPDDLVPTIDFLNLSHNQLIEFDGERFPTLKTLYLAFNDIITFTFPPNIVELSIKRNHIKSLLDFPNSLKIFDCSDNDLTDLPSMNEGLDKIDFSSNKLTSLPFFPNSVTHICGSTNKIKNVFFLPQSLKYLELSDNHLSGIICQLPQGLLTLELSDNMIAEMPDLPKHIKEINLNNNRINEFKGIPDSVETIDISNNCLEDDPRLYVNEKVELLCDNNYFNTQSDDEKNSIKLNFGDSDDDKDDKWSDMEGFWSTEIKGNSKNNGYMSDNDLDYKPYLSTYNFTPPSTYNFTSTTKNTSYINNPFYSTNSTNLTSTSKTNSKFKSSNPNYISVNYKKHIVV